MYSFNYDGVRHKFTKISCNTLMILAWYIVRFHIGPFLFGTLTVMFLFLMQFLMNNLDKLLGKGLETAVILQVIALSLAWMVVLAVPMGVLF